MSARPTVNRQYTLASRPAGFPNETDFRLVEAPVPALEDGQVLIGTLFLSVDPYMRGRISGMKSYATPVAIGQVMVGGAVGRVMESRNQALAVGDIVEAYSGWQEYAVMDGRGLRKIDASIAPVSTALGVLGMPGLTAYFGLIDVCDPKPGETVLVSSAAGAVGALAGQIARIKGCRAVGIAGSEEKIDYLLKDLGLDAAFNYKTVGNYYAKIRQLCPNGVDVYFDNVGGPITDAVFPQLNLHARVAICGQISQYNLEKPEMGPRQLGLLIVTRSKVQGFLVSDYAARFPEGLAQLAHWVQEGNLKYREDIVEGFENTPKAFIGMLKGDNIGKRLVKVAE